MNGNASIAEPSTTSITNKPSSCLEYYEFGLSSNIFDKAFVAMEPPIECPTKIIDLYLNSSHIYFTTSIVSAINVYSLISVSFSQ